MTWRACLLAAVAVAGPVACAPRPKPPLVNLYAHRRIAILPLRNDSADPALASDARAQLIDALRALHAADVADPDQTAALGVAPPVAGATAWADAPGRRKAAEALDADLLLAGAVTLYREDLKRDDPKRVPSRYEPGVFRWGYGETADAHVDATFTLWDAASGARLWTRGSPGDGKAGRWTDLAWPGDRKDPPANGGVLAPSRTPSGGPLYSTESIVARAREEAIAQVVGIVLTDFRGRDGWTPPAAAK